MTTLIAQHLRGLEAEGKSAFTIRDRGRCLRRLHEDLPHGIVYAAPEQLQAWCAGPQEPGRRWSPATRAAYTHHVIAFYAELTAAGYLPDGNPAAGLRHPRVPRRFPRPAKPEHIKVAMAAPEPLRTAVLLAMYEGMRRSEIAAAHREHITEDLVIIPVAKGGDTQSVPTHPVVWEHVSSLPDGPLIVRDGHPLTADRLSGLVLRWFTSHGMQGFGLHQLRHWYGTEIQRRVGDLRVTQECMRHASVATTQIYTLVTPGQRARAVELLPRVTEPGSDRLGDPHAA